MNDLVMPERVPTLSPIVTPLPFYQRPLACRQLAVAALVVLALIGGALRWHQLLMSVSPAREQRASTARIAPLPIELPRQVGPLQLELLIEPVRIGPVPLELVVLRDIIQEPATVAATGPCL